MHFMRLLCRIVILPLLALGTGCHTEADSVLLRYTPQVGHTYPYSFAINRPGAPIEIQAEMKVLSQDEAGFRLQFPGMLNELFSGSLVVTERHNASHPGYISLNFPDHPVSPGSEWHGEIPWYYEDHYVLDPTELRLPASYKLLGIEQGRNGRYVIIEQRIEADVAVDGLVFYVGQVGVRWDHEGRITEVYPGYDAHEKLIVGDVVVAINGWRATSADALRPLAETHIQHPKGAKTVTFTVLRDGTEHDIDVMKSIDEFAVVKLFNKRDVVKIAFDVDRGILLSAEVSSSYDIAYTSPTADTFPVVDDYAGFHKFGYMAGLRAYQTHVDSDGVAWTLSLIE